VEKAQRVLRVAGDDARIDEADRAACFRAIAHAGIGTSHLTGASLLPLHLGDRSCIMPSSPHQAGWPRRWLCRATPMRWRWCRTLRTTGQRFAPYASARRDERVELSLEGAAAGGARGPVGRNP
jgi:hypothetical protein